MQVISDEKIKEIQKSADIVDVISDYIDLKMQGKNYFGKCPFHDDHTPSMSVSKDKQVFKCFVCGKGGNVFTFVKDYNNIHFLEAVKMVADKYHIPVDFTYQNEKNDKFKLEYEIMDFTTKIFQNNLNSKVGVDAKKYLESRNITEDIIKEFRLGFSLNENNYLYNVLTKKNYDINKLDDLGLITKSGLTAYDKFQNRIMIPITNLDGKVVGFTGRIFNGEDSAKYVNTKETIIYKKGHLIFNYYNARNYIRDEKCAILVEGNMDAIRMYSSGIKNVLALMGTALTKEQVEILKRLRVPIILMLDNDNAGNIATYNIGEELIKNNITCKVVRLSGAKDPDEYIIKFGVLAFKDAIKHSRTYFDYKLDYLKENRNLNNTEELISYVKDVIKMLNKEDNLTKEITLKKLSEEYKLDYDTLKSEVTFKEEVKPKKIVANPVGNNRIKDKYHICSYNILYYMMSDSKYVELFNNKLGFLKSEEERNLVTEINYYVSKYGKIDLANFITYAEKYDNIKELVNNISSSVSFTELDEKIFMDYLKAVDRLLKKENIKEIRNKINNSRDINEQLENINRQIALAKKMLDVKKDV